MGHVNIHQLSNHELERLKNARWKARTDLLWLCRNILGYPDVCEEVHGPVINLLQRFPLPPRHIRETYDVLTSSGNWLYKPWIPMYELENLGRRRLILDPRSWLKTTVNAQAHTIQWILNYPDVTIQIIQSNTEKAELILGEIKSKFQRNEVFRELFPEHCPKRRVDDWGTKGQFITEARRQQRRESTAMIGAIDKGSAGLHFDVMKFSDIVEPSNVKTDEQILSVKKTYYMMENLLVRPDSWIDVEGTRYNFADLYGELLEKKKWRVHVRSCYKRIDPKTKKTQSTFTPDTLKWPFELDKNNQMISWWANRFPYEYLEDMRANDSYTFATQQLNDPTGDEKRQVFPVNDDFPKKITRKDFTQNVRVAYRQVTVDTAETQGDRSNWSVISVAAVASDGRKYVDEILRGKWKGDELIEKLFQINDKYQPQYIEIEETSYTRGIRVHLEYLQSVRNKYLPIRFLPRDNQVSKKERIERTLQPAYQNGRIIFLDDLVEMEAVKKELQQFPFGISDDILDTLADLYTNQEWFGRERSRPNKYQRAQENMNNWVYGPQDLDLIAATTPNSAFNRTGGM